jgi:tetratricopeptide (TPR) repeat protein
MNSKILYSITSLVYLILALLILIFGFSMVKNLKAYNVLSSEREKISTQIKTWESIVSKFKGYKDGYLQLAVLEYRLGEHEKAKKYVNQALYLDSNYKEALEFQKRLNNY